MMTRAEYMVDSSNLHQAYYAELAEAISFRWADPALIEKFRVALQTDPNMNNIPLNWWDTWWLGLPRTSTMREALKARGESYSLGTGVCVLKAAARAAVERAP